MSNDVAEIWKVNKDVLAGATQTWDSYLLGNDEHGTWLYTPTGTPIRNAQGQQVDTLQAQAQLYPPDKPWVASWFQDGSFIATVATPPETDNCSIRYTDLGMRHCANGADDGGQDETQEYDQALATGRVSSKRDGTLRAVFTDLKQQITEHVEPFGEIGPKWFVRITRNELHFVPYNAEWPARFATARDEILPNLPSGSRVEHFGSTSVPGLAAKDCIDIAVAVPHLDQVQDVFRRWSHWATRPGPPRSTIPATSSSAASPTAAAAITCTCTRTAIQTSSASWPSATSSEAIHKHAIATKPSNNPSPQPTPSTGPATPPAKTTSPRSFSNKHSPRRKPRPQPIQQQAEHPQLRRTASCRPQLVRRHCLAR